MIDIFKELSAILSAIDLSQTRKFHQMWKGKRNFRDARYRDQDMSNFIRGRLNSRGKTAANEIVKRHFMKQMDEDEYLRDRVQQEVENDLPRYKQLAVKNGWLYGFDEDEKYTLEDFDDPYLEEELIQCVVENGYFDGLPSFEEYKAEHYADIKKKNDRFIMMDTIDDFPYRWEKSDGRSRRNISELYDELFHGKYRLYLPIEITVEDIVTDKKEMNRFRIIFDYIIEVISRYYQLIKKSEEAEEVENNALNDINVFFSNYISGMYYSAGSLNPRSIGKMISLVEKKDPSFTTKSGLSIKDFKTLFNQRLSPFKGKVCISRHPYDIAGMSTGRGWRSCMNLIDGEYNYYVESSIMAGALIAYLIKDDDENINNPTSRLLIKPYIKRRQKQNFENPNWLLKVSDQYGTAYPKFAEVVQKWCNENWNNKFTSRGSYDLSKSVYSENGDIDSIKTKDLL